ncbi:glycoside hydrolase superfamily [Aspergillus undulatus]|uniref:glycoside hydrolase superfamily n=1 Tax=Aspergillus undulatus TaxID=1810928 RepID=UPI003CCCCE21
MIPLRRLLLALAVPKAVLSAGSIEVDTSSLLQEIHGFGFSQAFGRASDTETGAGFSIIRNNFPSSVDATIEPESPGSPSATPDYTWSGDDAGQVWFTKQAVVWRVNYLCECLERAGVYETSGDEAAPGYLCGTPGRHNCTSGDWRQAYANYLVQYVKYYESEVLSITHLGFLNEPDYESAQTQRKPSHSFQTLYQTVQGADLDPNITCCDAIGWDGQETYTTALNAAGMDEYLNVITSHMYTSDATSAIDTSLPTWLTKAGVETSDAPFTTTWHDSGALNEGMVWASKLATGFIDANLSAYLYWEGFEIEETQSASHLVDVGSSGEAEGSGIFYAFSMWSRFIRPGAHRVETSGSVDDVATAAFINTDGSVVVVLTNSGDVTQTAQIGVSVEFTAADAWVTDNDHQIAETNATVGGGSVGVDVLAQGVVTVKLT